MEASIQTHWDSMTTMKALILGELDKWSTADLQLNSENNGWNALQIIQHLIISEKGTLGYLIKKTSGNPEQLEQATTKHELNGKELQKALKSSNKWKAPSILPKPESIPLEKSTSEWENLHGEFHSFLANIDPLFIGLQVFRHPVAGRLDLHHTLKFLSNHIQHHMYQLERIKRNSQRFDA